MRWIPTTEIWIRLRPACMRFLRSFAYLQYTNQTCEASLKLYESALSQITFLVIILRIVLFVGEVLPKLQHDNDAF